MNKNESHINEVELSSGTGDDDDDDDDDDDGSSQFCSVHHSRLPDFISFRKPGQPLLIS